MTIPIGIKFIKIGLKVTIQPMIKNGKLEFLPLLNQLKKVNHMETNNKITIDLSTYSRDSRLYARLMFDEIIIRLKEQNHETQKIELHDLFCDYDTITRRLQEVDEFTYFWSYSEITGFTQLSAVDTTNEENTTASFKVEFLRKSREWYSPNFGEKIIKFTITQLK